MTRHAPRAAAIALLVATLAPSLGAQVGTLPAKSPFRDTEKRQEVSIIMGPTFGGKDKVGAAPQGGSAYGVRYDINLGASPLMFTSMITRQSSTRDILQPGLPLSQRIGATVGQPIWSLDGALTLLLTGNRSWHSVVPYTTIGAGIVTDNKGVTDSSQFSFGTRFAPVFGLGWKFQPERSRWTVRADFTNHFYNVPYPQAFRDSTSGVPRITTSKNDWVRTTLFSIGIVRQFGRR